MSENGDFASLVGAHFQPMKNGSGSLDVIRICRGFSTVREIRGNENLITVWITTFDAAASWASLSRLDKGVKAVLTLECSTI